MLDLIYEILKFKVIVGVKYDWEFVIGMEVYVQVSLNVKFFFGVFM